MHSSRLLSPALGLLLRLAAAPHPAAASFAEPEVQYRPKFRYWLPDASIPPATLTTDIRTIASAGAGGLELLPYYQYGLPESARGIPPPTDWTIYGYGTPAFRDIFSTALRAVADEELVMDFALGANQGAGVPTQNISAGAAGFTSTFVENTLGRVVDLTAEVDPDTRELSWTPPDQGESEWRLMVWYERYTNQKSCSGGPNATEYIGNGSWTVDHFSAAGSKKLTDFFDAHVIPDDETRELLASVGKYAWEDSMELVSSLWWTPELQSMFNESRGYDITLCLPYLITAANYWNGAVLPYGEGFVAENATFGAKCNEDYRTTLNEGYQEYLAAIQPSPEYGRIFAPELLPTDLANVKKLDDISILDAPEGESLGFNNIIDTYRQFSGPAHLSGISVISSECGALSGAPYQQTFNDLLWSVRRGLAAGISMHVLHGFAYSGPYTNTTWPSYTTFTYRFSEMWNQHQPSWMHINETIRYIARNQYVSQSGTPSVDLAFYLYEAPWTVSAKYMDTNLEALGYTYEYLSSNNLQAPEAVVEGNVLAPTRQSFKALIFSNASAITPGGAAKVQEFAEAGLPVFFVGATNLTSIGQEPGAAAEVASTIGSVVNSGLENVHTVASSADLPEALSSAGILPKVSFSNATSWYPFWRRGADDGLDYAFIYNDDQSAQTVDVTFATTGTPYHFDAWTGAITPVLQYTTSPSSITIPITLASNQTTILGFFSAPSNTTTAADPALPAAPPTHITSTTGAIAGLVSNSSSPSTITAYLTGPATLTLSNGTTHNSTASPPPATTLDHDWSISIADWHRTPDAYSMATAITYHNYTNATLAPWTELDGDALVGVSGVGRYSATFATPAGAQGALLSLGPATGGSMRAWVNGVQVGPLDN
ncbi:putative secreted protein [Diplodia seriata]|uniref:Putative secreted protein n=1 Tax=Diplodia seriata TaxID=420778 RepID=A0A0G2E1H6_9PEZI|nr:putative secreted protein [Diplodia seriata]